MDLLNLKLTFFRRYNKVYTRQLRTIFLTKDYYINIVNADHENSHLRENSQKIITQQGIFFNIFFLWENVWQCGSGCFLNNFSC